MEEVKDDTKDLVEQLLSAAQHNEVDKMRCLLSQRLPLINAQDSDGYTALHRASYNNQVDAAKLLLSRGADVDMKTLDGWQPLHSACKWNSVAVAKMLIEDGADVNARTKGGQTPLHLAASNGDARELLQFLLSLPHIETNVHNNTKDTPLQIAQRSGRNADLFEAL